MLDPLIKLWDLMSQMEMYAWLEDDVKQAACAVGKSSQGEGSFKQHKKSAEEKRANDK